MYHSKISTYRSFTLPNPPLMFHIYTRMQVLACSEMQCACGHCLKKINNHHVCMNVKCIAGANQYFLQLLKEREVSWRGTFWIFFNGFWRYDFCKHNKTKKNTCLSSFSFLLILFWIITYFSIFGNLKRGGIQRRLPHPPLWIRQWIYTLWWRHSENLVFFFMNTFINHRTPLLSSSKKEVID